MKEAVLWRISHWVQGKPPEGTENFKACFRDSVRDTQMLDTSSFSYKELSQVDPFSQEIEAFWHDMNVTPFIGVFVAKDGRMPMKWLQRHITMMCAAYTQMKLK